MKRTLTIALAFTMVFAFTTFSSVYACGEEGSTGSASNSSANMTNTNSGCGMKAAKTSSADATSSEAQIITADSKVDVSSSCHVKDAGAKVEKIDSDCAAKCAKAKAANASDKVETAPMNSDDDVSSVPSTSSEEVLTN